MAEYSSMKVPELKKLLSEKGLAQTGNKADLIARLQDNDQTAGEKPAAPSKEDEISYSDDEAPSAKPIEAAEEAQPADPTPAVESNISETAPAEVTAPAKDVTPSEPPPSFAIGLSTTAADAEAKKRADRAKRFGLGEDDDTKKRAERAERFGIDEKELASGLDSALPERPLKRGRGRGAHDGNRPEKRQSVDGRGRRGREQREGRGQQRGNILDDPTEKAKADKRAARFAAA